MIEEIEPFTLIEDVSWGSRWQRYWHSRTQILNKYAIVRGSTLCRMKDKVERVVDKACIGEVSNTSALQLTCETGDVEVEWVWHWLLYEHSWCRSWVTQCVHRGERLLSTVNEFASKSILGEPGVEVNSSTNSAYLPYWMAPWHTSLSSLAIMPVET